MRKILFYNTFIIRFYMFRAPCAHHQEVKVLLRSIWYHHTCRWSSGVQVQRWSSWLIATSINIVKTMCVDPMKLTHIPKGVLPDWALRDMQVTVGDRVYYYFQI